MTNHKGDWIQTYTGKKFYPNDPRPEDICIEDIAHGLALTCRYTGQCKVFYSVAQHSCLVAKIVTPENRLWGLLHDAAEAYIGDLPRAVKASLLDYQIMESNIIDTIASKYHLIGDAPYDVLTADNQILLTEGRDLMFDITCWGITKTLKPLDYLTIKPWSWQETERRFLKAFERLQNGKESEG